jgi:hypothetical protein
LGRAQVHAPGTAHVTTTNTLAAYSRNVNQHLRDLVVRYERREVQAEEEEDLLLSKENTKRENGIKIKTVKDLVKQQAEGVALCTGSNRSLFFTLAAGRVSSFLVG